MMRLTKKWLLTAISVVMLVILSACGSSLAKPTGLETTESKQSVELNEDVEEVSEEEEKEKDDAEDERDENDAESNDEKKEKNHNEFNTETKSSKDASESTSVTKNEQSGKQNETSSQSKKSESKQGSSNKSTSATKSTNKSESTSSSSANTKQTSSKSSKQASETKQKDTVVISIVISANEVPLPPTEIEIKDGDTVLDALIAVTKKHGIQLDYRGGQGSSAYVEGLANVYEFDRGQGSGWMYRVNGIFPDRSAGVVPLESGDRVEWLYTLNLGQDLGADLKPFRR